jgi:methylated-DNA-protein-cysteine methyltransferase-like protein
LIAYVVNPAHKIADIGFEYKIKISDYLIESLLPVVEGQVQGFDIDKATQIWKTACLIPAGKVCSYGVIADLAGLPGRARLVGKVLQQSPHEMCVPWYRIIKSNGQIAFAAGSSQARTQQGLLCDEGVLVLNNRVNMKQFLWLPDFAELMQMEF